MLNDFIPQNIKKLSKQLACVNSNFCGVGTIDFKQNSVVLFLERSENYLKIIEIHD